MGASVCSHTIAELLAVAGTAPKMNEIENRQLMGTTLFLMTRKNRVDLATNSIAFHQPKKKKKDSETHRYIPGRQVP
jgi:hypothetical protein